VVSLWVVGGVPGFPGTRVPQYRLDRWRA